MAVPPQDRPSPDDHPPAGKKPDDEFWELADEEDFSEEDLHSEPPSGEEEAADYEVEGSEAAGDYEEGDYEEGDYEEGEWEDGDYEEEDGAYYEEEDASAYAEDAEPSGRDDLQPGEAAIHEEEGDDWEEDGMEEIPDAYAEEDGAYAEDAAAYAEESAIADDGEAPGMEEAEVPEEGLAHEEDGPYEEEDEQAEDPDAMPVASSAEALAPDESGGSAEEAARAGRDAPGVEDDSPASGTAKYEVIALAVFGLLLVVGVAVFLSVAVKGIGADTGPEEVEFPVQGKRVVISAVETYWRKPDRDADRGVRLSARVIPAAHVTLASGSGALRFFFEDEEASMVGDPRTYSVTGGQFAGIDSDQTEVHATSGFQDEGDHAAYVTDQIGTWFLVILEGPDADAPGREFQELVRIPISKQRR